jgi:hypothetical protein
MRFNKKRRVIRSLREFERIYLPKSAGKIREKPENISDIGSIWAKETMRMIRKYLQEA